MSLISIILALFLDRLLKNWHELRELGWFEQYTSTLDQLIKIDNGAVKFVLVLLVPITAFLLFQYLLYGVLYDLPYILFSIIVVLYCLGPDCLLSDIENYIDARRLGEDDEARQIAGTLTEEVVSAAPDQQTSDVIKATLFSPNQRIFTVLFWFVVIGPIGAVLFRLSFSISKQPHSTLSQFADHVQALLAWLPARMLASSYALVGNFDGAVLAYKAQPYEPDLAVANYGTLVNIGLGALRDTQTDDEVSKVQAARNLVLRGVLCWIAVLALLTLGGWLS